MSACGPTRSHAHQALRLGWFALVSFQSRWCEVGVCPPPDMFFAHWARESAVIARAACVRTPKTEVPWHMRHIVLPSSARPPG